MPPHRDRAPLGLVQQHTLLNAFLDPGRECQHGKAVLHVTGSPDVRALRTALDLLWERHTALRASIQFDAEGEPHQTIASAHTPPPTDAALTTEMETDATGPVVLRLRWDPVRLDEHSIRLLVDDLIAVYAALTEGRTLPAAATHVSIRTPATAAERAEFGYWAQAAPHGREQADPPDPLSIAAGMIPEDPDAAVTVVTAAAVAVLARYTHEPDITVGILVRACGPAAVGAHTQPRRLCRTVTDSMTFGDLVDGLAEQRERAAAGPLVDNSERAAAHPLGRILVRHDPLTGQRIHRAGTTFHVTEAALPPGPAELTLTVCTAAAHPQIRFDRRPQACSREAVDRLARHLSAVLNQTSSRPDTPLAHLRLLTAAEHEQALLAARGPRRPWNHEPVHRQVAAQALATPDAVAVRFDGADLTYAALDARANQLAHHLRGAGVGLGDVVAILLDPCPDVFIAQLGVLKAGGAFVMTDPSHPSRRVQYTLEDSDAAAVITHSSLADVLGTADLPRVELDRDGPTIGTRPTTAPADLTDERSLAYLIYTSGSTGRPKGAVLAHAAMSNFLLWLGDLFDLGRGDRMLLHMALVFDFAHGEIFAALTRGAALVVADRPARTSPKALRELIVQERVTYLGGTPSLLGLLDAGPYPDLRYLLVGGESIPGPLVVRWNAPGRRLVSIYGPTETAVGCLEYECAHTEWCEPPPIGHPTANRSVHVLDRWNDPAPTGVPGEIHVGGLGVGVGYLGRPSLTASRFIPDPTMPGERMYATGDLGVRGDDGEIRFIGRIDSQVKINGLRIELEEVEAVLVQHAAVARAAVVPVELSDESSTLVAYFTVAGRPCTPEMLRDHLSVDLPTHMIPSRFIEVDALPLSTSGKIDRAVLRAREIVDDRSYVPPRTWAENQVARVFTTVTGHVVGANDRFPSRDPLMAMRVAVLLERLTGIPVTVDQLLRAESVAAVAKELNPDTMTLVDDEELLAMLELVEDMTENDDVI
ncbi:amino acid adenylation domain-containing protein [Streptomyces sp. SID7958]|uniref:Amino acid adenylation domain-containing protein n=2 Tax=unclassified Streptomyces TaxID=2593676 RepID=A0A6G3R152_9ACTN|nr:amino acid adenylation domain-containing protein [Streptomyces sp. SID14436]NEC81658.1 amino acid adenylation domain-containing protein [Streptomyces sp. SID7958]